MTLRSKTSNLFPLLVKFLSCFGDLLFERRDVGHGRILRRKLKGEREADHSSKVGRADLNTGHQGSKQAGTSGRNGDAFRTDLSAILGLPRALRGKYLQQMEGASQ